MGLLLVPPSLQTGRTDRLYIEKATKVKLFVSDFPQMGCNGSKTEKAKQQHERMFTVGLCPVYVQLATDSNARMRTWFVVIRKERLLRQVLNTSWF
jgi:hypothetical protein